ncbi:MAG: hypothetical protein KAX40_01000 [Herpetosiphon sp.]|nr:hypothetical protein [Herpetosiphon sp.]
MQFQCAGFQLSIQHGFAPAPLIQPFFSQNQLVPADLTITHHGTARSMIGQCVFNADLAWELRREGQQRQFVFRDAHLREPLMTCTLAQSTFPTTAVLHYDESQTLETWLFDYPIIQLILTEWLAERAGLLLHACAVRDGDRAYVFTGAPGVGKSTSARLWADAGATVLSDDRVILRWHDDQLWVYGTPWHSSTPLVAAQGAPVTAIMALAHGQHHRLTPLDPMTMFRRVIPEVYLPRWDTQCTDQTLATFDRVITSIPRYLLEFLPDATVIDYVRSQLA